MLVLSIFIINYEAKREGTSNDDIVIIILFIEASV